MDDQIQGIVSGVLLFLSRNRANAALNSIFDSFSQKDDFDKILLRVACPLPNKRNHLKVES